ncbi:MAG: hypothetical protein K5622_05135, partial [Endomicrobiaceae bacterium]|nr:hypothetical protein [Endomicrobiaceae bacterium]
PIVVIPINDEYMRFYSYYLSKSQYAFYALFAYNDYFYSVKQNISNLNGKDMFIILDKEEWFSVRSHFIYYLLHGWKIFDSVEILDNDVILCRNFNYEQYRKFFYYCSYELRY